MRSGSVAEGRGGMGAGNEAQGFISVSLDVNGPSG